jgi:hypothetical protein|tara:strand:- start:2349 stop:3929 length:1581 start_codon:yes stop_codon:yes gene_type:complete
MFKARERYSQLQSGRTQFLDMAVECSELTLPYLVTRDDNSTGKRQLLQPYQSVGAKAVVTLAAKLMLAILPPQTAFFKLQVRDDKLGETLDPMMRSELDLSFSKIERLIMDYIAASSDRVVVHQALKHLIVSGNALVFMGKDGLKHYPLQRYVVNRDGNGNVIEIVTKELISRKVLGISPPPTDSPNGEYGDTEDDAEVYTCVKMDESSGSWRWHQEVDDMILDGSQSTAPKNASPWLVLRFNTVDGEDYGRGRVEEFIGDLRSLDGLSQSLVEGASVASKVVFLVSPSATTKPGTLAKAGNGAIIQGRPEDVGVVQVGKTADFATAAQLASQIEKRILEAFLVMNIRNAERVTAEEVRLTQLELEKSLGGLFSLLTVEFLVPYLNRTLLILQRSNQIPRLPKDVVRPKIVAGINSLGRGQDNEALTRFIQTVAQTLGPEALMKFIDPSEAIKRLAAAQGIDVLNLVRSAEQLEQLKQITVQDKTNQSLVDQAGQLAGTPLLDPSKNPDVANQAAAVLGNLQPPEQ